MAKQTHEIPDEPILMTAEILLQATGTFKKTPKIMIDPVYAGGPMRISGWGLPVVIALKGLELPKQVPIAADHSTELTGLLGHGKPVIRKNRLSVSGQLNKSQNTTLIFELYESGQPLQASIGAEPTQTKYIPGRESVQVNGQTIELEGGFYLIEKSKLREVSIVGIGADSETNVKIAASYKKSTKQKKGTTVMDKETLQEIKAACSLYADLLPAEKLQQIQLDAIENDKTVSDVNAALVSEVKLHKLRSDRMPAPNTSLSGYQTRAGENHREVMAAASLLLYGRQKTAEKHYDEHTLQKAADLRCHCALDLCEASLKLNGIAIPSGQNDLIRAAFSTADMSNALANSATKELIEAYDATPATWRSSAAIRSTKNFHPHSAIRGVLKNGIYQPVANDGEIKHAKLDDEAYTFQSGTRGLMFGIGRQDIINDDIGIIFDLQRTLGINAGRTITKIYWETVRDSTTFFTTERGNYAEGTGSALGIDSLSDAIQLLREQQDGDNNPIGIDPQVLAVCPALESTARQIVASMELERYVASGTDNQPKANPWKSLDLKVEVEAHLGAAAGGSDKAWYLFGNPAVCPTVLVSFLNGLDMPVVESSDMDFNRLGINYRAYLDFGVDLADYRGCIKMLGEAES